MSLRIAAPIVLTALLGAQEQVMVDLPSGIRITRSEYQSYLYQVIGSARLEDLLLDRILERETAQLSLEHVAADVRAGLADPDAHVRELRAQIVERDFGGDEARWRSLLQRVGRTVEEELAALRCQALRQLRMTALVQARRRPDPARTRRVFEQHYGVDGLRVRVRHAFVSLEQTRRELAAAHPDAPPEPAAVARRAEQIAAELWQAWRDGTPFAELVARAGNDPQAKDPGHAADAGLLPNYEFQMFGVPFAEAVRAMRPGEVRGPIATTHGYHIISLDDVTRTRLEDVRDEVERLVREEPASLGEQRQLREALWREYGVAEALGK